MALFFSALFFGLAFLKIEENDFLEMFETFCSLFRQRYSYTSITALKWKYQDINRKSFYYY